MKTSCEWKRTANQIGQNQEEEGGGGEEEEEDEEEEEERSEEEDMKNKGKGEEQKHNA
jgi:hypothetical protein